MSELKVDDAAAASERQRSSSDVEDENDFYDAVEDVESSVKAMKIADDKSESKAATKAEGENKSSSEDEDEECQDCGACPLQKEDESSEQVKIENVDDDDEDENGDGNDGEQSENDDHQEATSQKEKYVPLHKILNEELQERKARAELAGEEEPDEDGGEGGEIAEIPVIDPYFVDEAAMQKEEEPLSVSELEERLKEAQNEKVTGNSLFKEEKYEEALEAYTKALRRCPILFDKERAVFYSNRSICFHKMKNNERCIVECTKAIELDPKFAKPLIRRAECYQATDKLDEALEDYKKLCELEPKVSAHKQTCFQLEQKIKDRNEKLKEEMMGKLKDLGNMVLKPFGLSTSNFQFVQDPATGSYSVNFKK